MESRRVLADRKPEPRSQVRDKPRIVIGLSTAQIVVHVDGCQRDRKLLPQLEKHVE